MNSVYASNVKWSLGGYLTLFPMPAQQTTLAPSITLLQITTLPILPSIYLAVFYKCPNMVTFPLYHQALQQEEIISSPRPLHHHP
jgi:hypothetical protein